jgi:streptogramin lyase
VSVNSIAIIDPDTNRVVGDVPVAGDPVAIATGAGGVWVANAAAGVIERIDPETRKIVARFALGTDVTSLAAGAGAVWVANGNDGTITRIDPATNRIKDTLLSGPADPLSPEPVFWIAAGGAGVWATRGDRLLEIDPVTDRVVSSRRIPTPLGLAVGASSVWLTTVDERLLRISRDQPTEASALELPAQTVAPALGGGGVWLIVYQFRTAVWQVDPIALVSAATSGSAALPSSAKPLQLAVGAGGVWSVDDHGGVVRFDPGDLHVVARIVTGSSGAAIAAGAGAIWVAVP